MPMKRPLAGSPEAEAPSLDRRIARSRKAVGSALMELLGEGRPFDEITVSEVAARAGLTRKTFYAHFGSVESIVHHLATDLFARTLSGIRENAFRLPLSSSGLVLAIFTELQRNIDELAPLTTLCPSRLLLEPARDAVETVMFPRVVAANDLGPIRDFDRHYLTHLTSSSIYGTLTAWAARGFEDRPEDIAAFVIEMMGPIADRIFAAARPYYPGTTSVEPVTKDPATFEPHKE